MKGLDTEVLASNKKTCSCGLHHDDSKEHATEVEEEELEVQGFPMDDDDDLDDDDEF